VRLPYVTAPNPQTRVREPLTPAWFTLDPSTSDLGQRVWLIMNTLQKRRLLYVPLGNSACCLYDQQSSVDVGSRFDGEGAAT